MDVLRPVNLFALIFLISCSKAHVDANNRAESTGASSTNGVTASASVNPAHSATAVAKPVQPVCAPLVLTLPKVTADLDVPAVDIEDPTGEALAKLYVGLANLLRGKAKDHVRIGVYGDSNLTMDWTTGEMRRQFQRLYGDAGHGFVAAGKPWGWYNHMDVRHDTRGGWTPFATSTHKAGDGIYGFANIAMQSLNSNSVSWFQNALDNAPIGKTFDRFDVFALRRPAGSGYSVVADGKAIDEVDANGKELEPIWKRYELEDRPHKIEIVAKGANLRLFGVALEKKVPGIIVDSLGVGALNVEQMNNVNESIHQKTLALRGYDLIIDLTGTNMFSLEMHPKWLKHAIDLFRRAIPDVPILLTSPPDLGHIEGGIGKADPRIAKVGAQKREIAFLERGAYWDFQGAMGGPGAIFKFFDKKLGAGDLVHLTAAGGTAMGGRLALALFTDFQRWLKKHAEAGCGPI